MIFGAPKYPANRGFSLTTIFVFNLYHSINGSVKCRKYCKEIKIKKNHKMFGERCGRCEGYYRCHISNKNYIFVGTLKGKLRV